ncbi:MAG: DegV family protein [Intestinimonas sp.]|jgi:DegV family protein with EDD domain|nr:DegV family protein [Intestinimonas sp.]
MSFRIIVDSCCDLSPSLLRTNTFSRVPLTLRIGDFPVSDDQTFDQSDFLRRMKASETAPRTACPSPAQYMDTFDCGADDLYVVTLSALLSGSHNSAQQARQIWLEEHPLVNIHIFNSCSASSGEVLLALRIWELARSGLPFQEVIRRTSLFSNEMKTMFVLESLDNLRKNGRLSTLQSALTGALHIKLLMGATPEGEICKLGQGMGIKQALSKMIDRMAGDTAHQGRTLSITHCNCLERAFTVRDMVRSRCQFRDIIIGEAGGVTTVYANDGGIVVAY